MTIQQLSPPVSRRDIVRSGAALGLLAPFGLGAAHVATAQESGIDYSDHPAVGVWIEAGMRPTFTYHVIHGDGTTMYYSPWLQLFELGDPKLAAIGFGVWQPVSDRTIETTFRVAWLDVTVAKLLKFKSQLTVSDDGNFILGSYKSTLSDPSGTVLFADSGSASALRLLFEPFDDNSDIPEASPESS